jgi:hypothetical protein
VWREKNLSDKNCHDIAAAAAGEQYALGPEERAAVDEWLDERYPERKKEVEKIAHPPFDVPRVQ